MIDSNGLIIERPKNARSEYEFKWHELYLESCYLSYNKCLGVLTQMKLDTLNIVQDIKKMIDLHQVDRKIPEDIFECYGIKQSYFDY